jgi:hypothetical protein
MVVAIKQHESALELEPEGLNEERECKNLLSRNMNPEGFKMKSNPKGLL